MTTEANNNDPRVSDAYREVAKETTSADLDRKVLAMAATEVRATRGVPSTWFRPLAWAATIALSFALVLEITQVDNVATPRTDADLAEVVEENTLPVDAAEKQKNEARMRQQHDKRSSDAPAAAKAVIAPAQPETPARDTTVNTPASESLAVAPDLEQDDPGLLREAEEEARLRSAPAQPMSALVERKEQPEGCHEDARASAETWYACVTVLRDAGRTKAAQQELDALLDEFPDFREPPGDQ